MHFLLSNDDGYQSPGLEALAKCVGELGEVTVVAPDRDRSAASNSLTLDQPIPVDQHETFLDHMAALHVTFWGADGIDVVGGDHWRWHLATIGGVPQVMLLRGARTISVAPADGTVLWEHSSGQPSVSIQLRVHESSSERPSRWRTPRSRRFAATPTSSPSRTASSNSPKDASRPCARKHLEQWLNKMGFGILDGALQRIRVSSLIPGLLLKPLEPIHTRHAGLSQCGTQASLE